MVGTVSNGTVTYGATSVANVLLTTGPVAIAGTASSPDAPDGGRSTPTPTAAPTCWAPPWIRRAAPDPGRACTSTASPTGRLRAPGGGARDPGRVGATTRYTALKMGEVSVKEVRVQPADSLG